MSSKTFRALHDFCRHGVDLWIDCAQGACGHHGVVDASDAVTWFRLHRFNDSLESALGARSAHHHFRCSKCGSRAGRIAPTQSPVTVTEFFPVSPDAWRKLARRLRD